LQTCPYCSTLEGGISAYVIRGKNMKRGKDKGGKCERKKKKEEVKVKMESKRVK
jgi:hypothetical protein